MILILILIGWGGEFFWLLARGSIVPLGTPSPVGYESETKGLGSLPRTFHYHGFSGPLGRPGDHEPDVFGHGSGPRGRCARNAAPMPRSLASNGPWPGQDGFVDAASTRAVCGICPLTSMGEIACFFRHAMGS